MHNYTKPSPQPKTKVYRSEKYLKFIRSKKCGVYGCGKDGEPHHIRRHRWGAGTSVKPHDYVCVSRCREHHDPCYDDFGEGMMVELEIIDNLMEYLQGEK